MRIAVLGKGKTGRHVIELIEASKHELGEVFDSSNLMDVEKLRGHDMLIAFVPGQVFEGYFDVLVESKVKVITGTTGLEWNENQLKLVKDKKLQWIHGHNFSLGMNVIRNLLGMVQKATSLLSGSEYTIHEVHHTKKLDAPSGTALKWKDWLGMDKVNMTYDRLGDVIGEHELIIESDLEKIQLKHESKDRKLFAQGALWAADQIYNDASVGVGIIKFEDLVDQKLGVKA